MPRATRTTKKHSEKAKEADLACDLCDGPFKGTEEVLHCKGNCRKHMHKYCAGVSKCHPLQLTKNSTPFVCLICTQQLHEVQVQILQNDIAALKAEHIELHTALPSLIKQAAPVPPGPTLATDDVLQTLKADVEKLQPTVSNQVDSYANAVYNGRCRGNLRNNQLIKSNQTH